MKRFFILLNLILGIAIAANTSCSAQSSASFGASAIIVSPITVSQTDNMVFGNIPIPSSTPAGATNVAAATGSVAGVITQTGGGTLSQTTSSTATATFNVSGQASAAYNVTLPSTVVTLTNGSDVMTASTFTSTSSSAATQSTTSELSSNGADVVKVGASLNLNARQQGGVYLAADPFTVTINYN